MLFRIIKSLYIHLLVWWDTRKLDKFIERELLTSYTDDLRLSYYEDDVARMYAEGILKVKTKINNKVKARTADEYHKVLMEVKELIVLAKEETIQEARRRRVLENVYVRKEVDVKSKKDKKKMIEQRIEHYEELRKYNEQRALLKQIKALTKDGKHKEAEELTEKWKKLYDQSIRKPRRH